MDDSNKTILIADDDQFITIAYKQGLERHGYYVVIAHDGEEALQQIADISPDAVLLDIMMPSKDGFEVLQAVKSDPNLARIPILVLSSLSQESDEKTAMEYGADDFLVKSEVTLNEILLRVQRLFEQAADDVSADTDQTISAAGDLGAAESSNSVEASTD